MPRIKDNHQATQFEGVIPREFRRLVSENRLAESKFTELLEGIKYAYDENSIPKNICNTNNLHIDSYRQHHPLAVKKGQYCQIGVQRCFPMSYGHKPFGNDVLDFDPDIGEFVWYNIYEWKSRNYINNINNSRYSNLQEIKGNTMPSLLQYIPMGIELEYISRLSKQDETGWQCDGCAEYDYDNGDDRETFCYDDRTCDEEARGFGSIYNCGDNDEIRKWEENSFRFLAELNLSFGAVGTQGKRVWIAKSDSTVDIEFVSAPMTLRAYKMGFAIAEYLFNSFDVYSEHAKGFYGPCGAHIHIDKQTIDNPYQYYAFLSMHYENPELIATIAQRSIGSDSEWCYLQKPDEVARFAYYKSNSGTRGAVHVGHNTVELRYFRSNLKVERLLKNLEFTQALYHFVTQLSYQDMSRDNGHKAKYFLLWIRAYRNTYKNLFNFLTSRGWLGNDEYTEMEER